MISLSLCAFFIRHSKQRGNIVVFIVNLHHTFVNFANFLDHFMHFTILKPLPPLNSNYFFQLTEIILLLIVTLNSDSIVSPFIPSAQCIDNCMLGRFLLPLANELDIEIGNCTALIISEKWTIEFLK